MPDLSLPSRPWIAYGVNGDGLGHAARALVLIPQLLPSCKLLICSSGAALIMLQEHFGAHPDVIFAEVAVTPAFVYCGQRINALATACCFLQQMLLQVPLAAWRFRWVLVQHGVRAVITDFEPVLARAGQLASCPVLCISHQHALVAFRLSDVGFSRFQSLVFRVYAALMAPAWSSLVLSSFFQLHRRPAYRECLLTGGLLRRELFTKHASINGKPLVYLRRTSNHAPLLALINQFCLEAAVFGVSPAACAPFPRLHYQSRDSKRFLDHLAEAPFVIGAPGHQLLCEAIELRKPVLAVYEPIHSEQRLNAVMLEQMGYGRAVAIDQFTGEELQLFLADLPRYRTALKARVSAVGNPERVGAFIKKYLPKGI